MSTTTLWDNEWHEIPSELFQAECSWQEAHIVYLVPRKAWIPTNKQLHFITISLGNVCLIMRKAQMHAFWGFVRWWCQMQSPQCTAPNLLSGQADHLWMGT
jgi:hypothetical protein